MLDYLSGNRDNTFLNKKVNHSHFDKNKSESTKDLLTFLKKWSQTTSINSNDFPPKLEFVYSHTLNSSDQTIIEEINKTNNQFKQNKAVKANNQFDLFYKGTALIGGGLNNMGNTCFLNSVLQCIIYTLPIQNYLLHSEHVSKCKSKTVCFFCELVLIVKALQERNSIAPHGIIRNIKLISKHIRIGRQEDAHEFFIFFLDSLEKSYNNYVKTTSNKFIINKKKNNQLETNLIQNIFGGELISEVVCLKCRHKSITNDQILALSLEINNADCIEKCLDNFCKAEPLFGSNKVFCDQCKMKNDSKKKFMFKTLPNVLVIHLKRFDNYQRKIQKFIRFNNELDMRKYITEAKEHNNGSKYTLYAILIHNGYSSNSGHYYSFLKKNNAWYEMNDSSVQKVAESFALNQTPYMIFYQKTQIVSQESYEIIKESKREEPKKVSWQYDNININNIHVVYSNKRKKRILKINDVMKNHQRNKTKKEIQNIHKVMNSNSKSNDLSISENEEEDTYALMIRNFGENLHKINHQYENDEDSSHHFNQKNKFCNLKEDKLMIKSNNLRSLYNSNNISLWDDNDNDYVDEITNKGRSKVSEQIDFISKAHNHFVPKRIKTKSEYDIKLDEGKTKKIHLKSNNNYHNNYFQSISNRQLNN